MSEQLLDNCGFKDDCTRTLRAKNERLQARVAQIEALQTVVDAVKPISDACWDSEHGEWTYSDNDIIKLREKYAALSEEGEKE